MTGWHRSSRMLIGPVFLLAAGLAACTVRPLYGPVAATGAPLTAELVSVEIPPLPTRVGQELRNQLIFAFTGGGAAAAPLYRLDLTVSGGAGGALSSRIQTFQVYRVTASYRLTDAVTGAMLASGSVTGTTSYNVSNQGFADYRAERDAENRAAADAAEQIRLAVSAAVAGGG